MVRLSMFEVVAIPLTSGGHVQLSRR